jgi:hypothetical protein
MEEKKYRIRNILFIKKDDRNLLLFCICILSLSKIVKKKITLNICKKQPKLHGKHRTTKKNRKNFESAYLHRRNIFCFNFALNAFKIFIYSDTESKPSILTNRSSYPILITNNLNPEFYF